MRLTTAPALLPWCHNCGCRCSSRRRRYPCTAAAVAVAALLLLLPLLLALVNEEQIIRKQSWDESAHIRCPCCSFLPAVAAVLAAATPGLLSVRHRPCCRRRRRRHLSSPLQPPPPPLLLPSLVLCVVTSSRRHPCSCPPVSGWWWQSACEGSSGLQTFVLVDSKKGKLATSSLPPSLLYPLH